MALQERRNQFDWPLFLVTCAISLLGVINLYSASSVMEGRHDIYIQQIYWLTFGAGLAVVAATVDVRMIERYAWVAYVVGIVLLLWVLLFGKEVRGSARWIAIGSFTLQPSELIKVVIVVVLARYLHHDAKIGGRNLRDLLVPCAIVTPPIALIVLQPDLGTSLMCLFIFATVMLLTSLKRKTVLLLFFIGLLGAPVAWALVGQNYQSNRIEAFLNPDLYADTYNYHPNQSLIAIGSGGLAGKGFLRSTQNQFRYLPDQHSDFPFSIWAEEHGFIASAVLIGLYAFLILWGLKIASQARDRFGAVLAVGVSAILFWHAFVNLAMVLRLLPVVGVTLPLFSYGGSSTLSNLLGIGLLMNVSLRRN